MILGIDPKVDFAFKYLLGRDRSIPILIQVLNSILQLPPGSEIVEITLLNPYNLQETANDKLSILDIKAKDQTGRHFNVEMQMLAHSALLKRILYYWSNLHPEQLGKGDDYELIRPTISICFVNDVIFPNVLDHHLCFRLLEQQHHFAMTDDIEFHIFELPKFTKSLNELVTGLDKWLYFLRHGETIDSKAVPPELQQPAILRAVEELAMLTDSEVERQLYEFRLKAQMDHTSWLNSARREGERRGEQIGTIHLCEKVLQRPQTPKEQLLALPLADLTRIAAELEQELLNRQSRA